MSGALGGLLFGYDWVVIGGAKPFYELYFHLSSPRLQGWAMSCALIGCLLGAVARRRTQRPLRKKAPAHAGRSGLFALLDRPLGTAGVFFVFACICAAGLVFLYLRLPETRNQSLKQIEPNTRARKL